MPESNSIFDFTLHYLAPVGAVMLLGLMGGKVVKRLKMPKVTGYLLAGVVIGPSVFGLISHEVIDGLSIITDIALGLILFSLGGVFELHHLKDVGKKVVWLTVGQSLGALVFATGAMVIAGLDWYTALLIGTLGIATAPAATVLVIREFEAKGEFTDTLISTMAVSNIVGILAFEFIFSMGELKEGASIVDALLSPVYELGGSMVIGFTVGWLISKWEQHVDDQAELLMIIIGGVTLVTGLAFTLGLQPLFAALIMGAVTTNLSLMHRLAYVELRQVEQPLYIAFFVLAGASLHLEFLPEIGLAGLAYLVFRVLGKMVGIHIVCRINGLSTNTRKYLGLGMMVQAGVAIGLVETINRSRPDLGAIVTPIILATVLIYETIGPPVIRLILFKVGEAKVD